MSVIKENDEEIEKIEKKIVDDEEDESSTKGEVEVGSYKMHITQAKKGLEEFRIWGSLTQAVVAMAMPNEFHRIDLRNKEVLKKMSEDLNLPIDFDFIDTEVSRKPYLIKPNSDQKAPVDKTKDDSGKPLTKKAMKENAKRDKVQAKIDVLKEKHKKLKDKKCDRAIKLKAQIDELETKRDRI